MKETINKLDNKRYKDRGYYNDKDTLIKIIKLRKVGLTWRKIGAKIGCSGCYCYSLVKRAKKL